MFFKFSPPKEKSDSKGLIQNFNWHLKLQCSPIIPFSKFLKLTVYKICCENLFFQQSKIGNHQD